MEIVTIRDVAKTAGVSISTVSRVLNNRPDVGVDTKQKVLKVVKELGYVRNTSAASLKQLQTDFVAVVLRGRRNIFLMDLAERILEIGKEKNIRFLTEIIDEKADEFEAVRRLYMERKLTGVIFLGSKLTNHEKEAEELDLPCVFASIEASFLKGTHISSVSVDNFKAGKAVMDRLISLGHKSIALLGYFGPISDATGQRLYGAKSSMEEHGIEFNPLLYEECDFTLPSSYAAMSHVLDNNIKFSAVFASSDIIAIGAMKALSDRGLDIPKDVSVIGFDGIEQSAYTIPSLSTVMQPSQEMASKAVDLLIDALEGKKGRHIRVLPKWIEGQSVRSIE
ncbi:MAG: LacI family DNA-binding transcriptional regulator [Eubacteriales bacterium]|nr:LacI family DNA-binding transcriptional regulator [Eubacteriales bacterium]